MVFDVRNNTNRPIYQSTVRTGKHTDPVWQVFWQEEDLSKELNFFSVSSDGRVAVSESGMGWSRRGLQTPPPARRPRARCC